MKKEEFWKYISTSLTIVSILLLAYAFLYTPTSGINMNPTMLTTNKTTGLMDVNIDVFDNNPDVIPLDTIFLADLYHTQDKVTHLFVVGNTPNGMAEWGQEITFPVNDKINGFYFVIGRAGMPTEPLYLAVTNADLTEIEAMIEIQASTLPKSVEQEALYWVGHIFEDNPTFSSKKFFLYAGTSNPWTDGNNVWVMGVANTNPYAGGSLHTLNSNGQWVDPENKKYDSAFMVYAESTNPPESPPALTISISFSQALQATGIITLLGACLSFVKYGNVIGLL
jgi:hypothetical protein